MRAAAQTWEIEADFLPQVYFRHSRDVQAYPDGTGGYFIVGDFARVNDFVAPKMIRIGADGRIDRKFKLESGVNYIRSVFTLKNGLYWLDGSFVKRSGYRFGVDRFFDYNDNFRIVNNKGFADPTLFPNLDRGYSYALRAQASNGNLLVWASSYSDFDEYGNNISNIQLLDPSGKLIREYVEGGELGAIGFVSRHGADGFIAEASLLNDNGGYTWGLVAISGDGTLDLLAEDVDLNDSYEILYWFEDGSFLSWNYSNSALRISRFVEGELISEVVEGFDRWNGQIVPWSGGEIGVVESSGSRHIGNELNIINRDGSIVEKHKLGIGFDARYRISKDGLLVQKDSRLGIDHLVDNGKYESKFELYNPGWIENLVVLDDNRLVIFGFFDEVGGYEVQNIAILQPDGSVDRTFALSENSNDPRIPGENDKIVKVSDDRIYMLINGSLDHFNDLEKWGRSYSAIIRRAPDFGASSAGTLAIERTKSFGPIFGSQRVLTIESDLLFLSVDYEVYYIDSDLETLGLPDYSDLDVSMQVAPDGSILYSGNFTRIENDILPGIARFDLNGMLDREFKFHPKDWDYHPKEFVLLPSGSFLLSEDRSSDGDADLKRFSISNNTSNKPILRFHSDGSLDREFTAEVSGQEFHFALERLDGSLLGFENEELILLNRDGSRNPSLERVLEGTVWERAVPIAEDRIGNLFLKTRIGGRKRVARLRRYEGLQRGIAYQPENVRVSSSMPIKLDVGLGRAYQNVEYQWFKDGEAIEGEKSSSYSVRFMDLSDEGNYYVRIKTEEGTFDSEVATVELVDSKTRIKNFSASGQVSNEGESLVGGFVFDKGDDAEILARAVGPSALYFGLRGHLEDPALRLYEGETLLRDEAGAHSSETVLSLERLVGAFPLRMDTEESAVVESLDNGAYSLSVFSPSAESGNSLLEIYDTSVEGRLSNASMRGFVSEDNNALVMGFAVSGSEPKTLLIRGIGPGLAAFGVENCITKPKMTLFIAPGSWRRIQVEGKHSSVSRSDLLELEERAGAFPVPYESGDCAIVLRVDPGQYTVHLEDLSGEGGVGLLELYDLDR